MSGKGSTPSFAPRGAKDRVSVQAIKVDRLTQGLAPPDAPPLPATADPLAQATIGG